MYTLRLFDLEGHQDTEYATVDEAYAVVYVDPLPDPTTFKIRPKAILPTGTITGCKAIRLKHLQVHKASVDPNAIVR